MTADRLTVNKQTVNQWIKLGPHKWKHSEGFIVARYWTIGVAKVYYFSCFRDEELYYKGINEESFPTLRMAKNYFIS